MKNKTYFLNTVLSAVLGILLLGAVLVRTFAPNVIIPAWNIPSMVLVSLLALLIDFYGAKNAERCYAAIVLLGGASFGLLPYAAGFAAAMQALKIGIVGGIVFGATAWLFSAVQNRLSSGPAVKAAPVLSALGLYLAAQCFMGILL